ncbi:MAG TPA: M50 family metallopeptidase [Chlamydiales bacterium]|nr:M50 family metallopeptidase [Chlamydiales bacterium]
MIDSFLKSVLFGDEGSYKIFGIRANFENEPSYPSVSLEGAGLISKMAYKCLNSNAFRWITQGYAHVFIHELGHALACKLLTNQISTIHVSKSTCAGIATFSTVEFAHASDWKKTIVNVAGPLGNIAFSSCKLVAATALKNYLSWPIALALGSGGVIWISGELFYACISVSNRDAGDFGRIARRGGAHLALAGTALVSQVALGIFAAIKLAA